MGCLARIITAWYAFIFLLILPIPLITVIFPLCLLGGLLGGFVVALLTLAGYRSWKPRTITAADVEQGVSNLPKLRRSSPFGWDPAWPSYLVGQSRVDLYEIGSSTVRLLDDSRRKIQAIGKGLSNPLSGPAVRRAALRGLLYPAWLMVGLGALLAVAVTLVTCGFALLAAWAGWLLVVGVLRGGDVLVRKLRKASGSCQSCYHVSELPAFPCNGCGRVHRDLRPGLLGSVRRRCVCGAVLPTTVLRATRWLQTSCPNCLAPLRAGAGTVQDIRLPVFGPVSAGKTRLVYAGLLALQDRAAAAAVSVDFVDDESRQAFKHGTEIINTGADTTKTPAGQLPRAITADLTVARRKALLHVFDAAGEFYINRGDNSELLFLDHAQGLVFVVDPFSIPWVQDRLGGLSQVTLARANAAVDDPEQVYHVTAGRLRDWGVRTAGQRLAIAVVKADLLLNLPPARELQADRVRDWLRDAGLDNLVLAAERDFAEVGYFLVASVPERRASSPMSAADPFLWLMARAGLRLLPDEFDPAKKAEEVA